MAFSHYNRTGKPVIAMSKRTNQTPRDRAADSYGQYFGMMPPLLYIGHLSDDDFIALIEAAVRTDKPIAVDDIDDSTDQNILL